MGHIHLAVLPGTKKWRQVVALLDAHAADDVVIAASAIAAERDFARAANDPVLVEAVRLLALIPHAARSSDFGAALRDIGLEASDAPLVTDLLLASGRALERTMREEGDRTDFGEIVRRSLIGTLSDRIGDALSELLADRIGDALPELFADRIGDALPGLFAADAADVQSAAARMGRPPDFSAAARAFFGRLTADTLASWLDRTLSAKVGPGQRFASVSERAAFDEALDQHCAEATRIIREFAGGWYGKTLHRDGTITQERAAAFAAVAFRKITEELHRKRDAHV